MDTRDGKRVSASVGTALRRPNPLPLFRAACIVIGSTALGNGRQEELRPCPIYGEDSPSGTTNCASCVHGYRTPLLDSRE